MPDFDINLQEVQYKPPLPPGTYTFQCIKTSIEQAKEPNKTSGQREWYIKAELKPVEAEGYVVFHMWSLSNAALSVEDPTISLKKLYEEAKWPVGPKINSDDLLSFTLVANTKLDTYNGRLNPKIEKVLSVVAGGI